MALILPVFSFIWQIATGSNLSNGRKVMKWPLVTKITRIEFYLAFAKNKDQVWLHIAGIAMVMSTQNL